MDHLENENTGRTPMGPENDHLSAWLHGAAHLAQDLDNLVLGKMFDHSQIICPIKAAAGHIVQVQNVAVTDSLGARDYYDGRIPARGERYPRL